MSEEKPCLCRIELREPETVRLLYDVLELARGSLGGDHQLATESCVSAHIRLSKISDAEMQEFVGVVKKVQEAALFVGCNCESCEAERLGKMGSAGFRVLSSGVEMHTKESN